jgi:choline dehydrogenase
MDSHDVVVVGGGDAGSVLAARLSERGGLKVLLIDTGNSERPAMRFARGHHSGYRHWADWDFYDLLPYFKRSENAVGRDLILRGRGGPVTVASPAEASPFLAAALEGAEEIGERRADDINSGFEEGFGPADFAADGYVVPAGRVVHNALVHRVRFARGRAVGVDYSVGSRLVSVAAGQVVVAGGAAESAQLLMLSGIGPAGHLRDRGIDVVADLPGVGANLQAHPVAKLVHGPSAAQSEEKLAAGEVIGLVRSEPELDGPDLRLTFGHGHTVHVSVILPHSRGSVRLADALPGTPPLVEPNFYSDDRDLSAVVAGLRLARRIAASDALSGWLGAEQSPGPINGGEQELREYARRTVTPYGKAVGTLAMGAVVDGALRLRGVDGVRVAGSAVMPSIPSADITATVYAIAERAAELTE